MPGAEWFPGATLNYAERMLPARDEIAVVARSATHGDSELTFDDLRGRVASARAGLARLGVGKGDRVVAYLPNVPDTLVAFLATASLGAIWASVSPEFGPRSAIDRFAQIEPKVLLAVDVSGFGKPGTDEEFEETLEAVASLAARFVRSGLSVGLATNGAVARRRSMSDITEENGRLGHASA